MISGTQALKALRTVIAGRESYRYRDDHEMCTYVEEDNTTPACVVGHALGAIDSELLRRVAAVGRREMPIAALAQGLHLSSNAVAIFMAAQDRQDFGGTWEQALEDAEEMAATLAFSGSEG